MRNIGKTIALLKKTERHLADSFLMLADRHHGDAEVRQIAKTLAKWSRDHIAELEPFAKKYGRRLAMDPDRLRAALFHDPRVGGLGLLRDLQDLALLATSAHYHWVALEQAGRALGDAELVRLCQEAGHRTDRQIAWLDTHMKPVSTHALTVPPARGSELASSVPSAHPAALPDALWAPLSAAVGLLVVGLFSLTGSPFLLPSLGPTAYLMSEEAPHPSTRIYNVVGGHLLGLGAGFLAVTIVGAWNDPVVLSSGTMTAARMGAAVLATLLFVFFGLFLRASHAPAAATALLVALGSLRTGWDVLHIAVGAAILAVVGSGLRHLRMGRFRRAFPRARAGVAGAERAPIEPARTLQPAE